MCGIAQSGIRFGLKIISRSGWSSKGFSVNSNNIKANPMANVVNTVKSIDKAMIK
jgi:hypothetical protein